MNKQQEVRSRTIMIGIAVVLMGATIYIVGESLYQSKVGASLVDSVSHRSDIESVIASEAGMFSNRHQPTHVLSQASLSGQRRTLTSFYANRFYPGSPPPIPHPVKADMARVPLVRVGNECLVCHEHGGYVPKFTAYAPVTPHPEMKNCRQCHVEVNRQELFQETTWTSVSPPTTARSALPGSPPPIPHTLQMRSACLACHGGRAAVEEIRVRHPERVHCRQCHAAVWKDNLEAQAKTSHE